MDVVPSQSTDKDKRRRSQRVKIEIPLVVQTQADSRGPASEKTHTMVVNAHGALIALAMKVSIGQLLTITNAKTDEELDCHVAYIGPAQTEKPQVGIEFEKPAPRFWHIGFPPEDWTRHSPEAKQFSKR